MTSCFTRWQDEYRRVASHGDITNADELLHTVAWPMQTDCFTRWQDEYRRIALHGDRTSADVLLLKVPGSSFWLNNPSCETNSYSGTQDYSLLYWNCDTFLSEKPSPLSHPKPDESSLHLHTHNFFTICVLLFRTFLLFRLEETLFILYACNHIYTKIAELYINTVLSELIAIWRLLWALHWLHVNKNF